MGTGLAQPKMKSVKRIRDNEHRGAHRVQVLERVEAEPPRMLGRRVTHAVGHNRRASARAPSSRAA